MARSTCSACNKVFSSISSFDKHREGPYTARQCLSEGAMVAKGMAKSTAKNGTEIWSTGGFDISAFQGGGKDDTL